MGDDGFKTIAQAIADLEQLPELSPGRIYLNAIKALAAEELVATPLEGPEDHDRLLFEAMITVGALSDGRARFHVYPSGSAADDLALRDAALADIDRLKGARGDPAELLALAQRRPSTTFATFAQARTEDGVRVTSLFRHPSVSKRDAIGYLKLTAEYIRANEAAASKGGN